MKKAMIRFSLNAGIGALGVLSASLAGAQANVTLYGVIDVTAEVVKATGSSVPGKDVTSINKVSSNSSNFGFTGNESLGNGLSAFFQIETGFNADTGTGTVASRDTFLGLGSETMGSIKMGFMTSPLRGMGGKLNFIPGSTS